MQSSFKDHKKYANLVEKSQKNAQISLKIAKTHKFHWMIAKKCANVIEILQKSMNFVEKLSFYKISFQLNYP